VDPIPLRVIDGVPSERSDAQRDRERILTAAECLIAASGVDSVSVDRIAAYAGVGRARSSAASATGSAWSALGRPRGGRRGG